MAVSAWRATSSILSRTARLAASARASGARLLGGPLQVIDLVALRALMFFRPGLRLRPLARRQLFQDLDVQPARLRCRSSRRRPPDDWWRPIPPASAPRGTLQGSLRVLALALYASGQNSRSARRGSEGPRDRRQASRPGRRARSGNSGNTRRPSPGRRSAPAPVRPSQGREDV